MDQQYAWGVRYIDELICRDDATPERLYVTQDANFNLTGIVSTSGDVAERYALDPYQPVVLVSLGRLSTGIHREGRYIVIISVTEDTRMAMGKRKQHKQPPLFVLTTDLPQTPSHPFYRKLNEVLAAGDFDAFVQGLCAKFYEETMGRPSLPPGVYFRLLLLGYFEGIDSERGIAWRCADSSSLRMFLGYEIDEPTPDHSTISRTRRLIDLQTHQEVFQWVLKLLAKQGLVDGKTGGDRLDHAGGQRGDEEHRPA